MEYEHGHQVTIAMPRADAWTRLRDLGLAHHYVPGLVDTRIRSERREGVGASRRVWQGGSRWIDETVTEWVDGHGFVIRLHREDKGMVPPFGEAHFRYWLEDAPGGGTLLSTSLRYTLRWGPLGRWLERRVMGKAIARNVREVAICLKDYYERGVPVDAARLAELRAAG